MKSLNFLFVVSKFNPKIHLTKRLFQLQTRPYLKLLQMNSNPTIFRQKFCSKPQIYPFPSRNFSIDDDFSEFVEAPKPDAYFKDTEVPPFIMKRLKQNGDKVWEYIEFGLYELAHIHLQKYKDDLDKYYIRFQFMQLSKSNILRF